jgi:NADH-quinone oxidoreductase subunit H
MQQQGANRAVVIAFTAGIVLLLMAVSSLVDRNKAKSQEPIADIDIEAPDFPVPSLPHLRSINVSGGQQ